MEFVHIDTSQIAKRFAQAGRSYDEHGTIQKKIASRLMQLMLAYQSFDHDDPTLKRIFEIGCGSGNLTKLYMQNQPFKNIYLNDLYPEVKQYFESVVLEENDVEQNGVDTNNIEINRFENLHAIEWHIGDAEQIDFPKQLDLIVSSSAIQWMHNLDALFNKANQALLKQGLFCFSTFGKQNLKEIKALTQQGLSYYDISEIQQKLQDQGFEVLHISEHVDTLNFKHPKDVLQHLKATGVTATASKFRWTKQSLADFYQAYRQFITTDQHENLVYPLSYHPIYVIARSVV